MKHYGLTVEGLIHDHNSIVDNGIELPWNEHMAEMQRRKNERILEEFKELHAQGIGTLVVKTDGSFTFSFDMQKCSVP